jgi:hypothetical protein
MKMTKFGGTFLNYQDAVRNLVIAADAYPSPDWFKTQMKRIATAYDLGEPVEWCAETIAAFGKGAMVRKTKTPRDLAIRVVKGYLTSTP